VQYGNGLHAVTACRPSACEGLAPRAKTLYTFRSDGLFSGFWACDATGSGSVKPVHGWRM